MSFAYSNGPSRLVTPQTEPAHAKQVENSASGFSFALDDFGRLRRFLVLGSDGGSYYATGRALTKESALCVERCLVHGAKRTIETIVEVSQEGRAPKNSPAIFALALAASHGSAAARQQALAALPLVCRNGTHLFEFVEYAQANRGWGRALRRAVANWYTNKPADKLAYQLLKYQQRNGWSNRDLLRKSHPVAQDEAQNALFRWATGKASLNVPAQVDAYMTLKDDPTEKRAVQYIRDFRLTREMIPTELLGSVPVWEALLDDMPMMAMIRNLGKMSSVGLIKPMSDAERIVAERLGDVDRLRKARVHPLSVLVALNTYKRGCGVKGSLRWDPSRAVLDALDGAFYLAFDAIEPTGKRVMLALDVSGSMTTSEVAGMTGITPRVGSAAMAMVTARSEKQWHAVAFTSDGSDGRFRPWTQRAAYNYAGSAVPGFWKSPHENTWGARHGLAPLDISPRQRLDDVVRTIDQMPMGGTDCALPMLYALDQGIKVDAFVIYTDNETWAGKIHPHQALEQYRRKTGIDAKLVVVGMVANEFSIAPPNDPNCLDVVGFDTSAPAVIVEHVRGSLMKGGPKG